MTELSFKPETAMSPLRRAWELRKVPLLAPIWIYKKCVSPMMPPACRHFPTCSEYTFMAIKQRGIIKGMAMGTWRVVRCNPWGTSGYDPVEAFRWPWESGGREQKSEVRDPEISGQRSDVGEAGNAPPAH